MKINRPVDSINLSPFKSTAWWRQVQDGLRFKPRKLSESGAAVGTPEVVDSVTAYAFAVGLSNVQKRQLVALLDKAVDNIEPEAEIERLGLEFVRAAARENSKTARAA